MSYWCLIFIALTALSLPISVATLYKFFRVYHESKGLLEWLKTWPHPRNGKPKERAIQSDNHSDRSPSIFNFYYKHDAMFRNLLIELNELREASNEDSRFRDRFRSILSHELRTPVHGIMGILQLLEDDDCSPEERLDYLKLIKGSTEDLFLRINDLLVIEGIEHFEMIAIVQSSNMIQIMNKVIKRFEYKAYLRNNKLTTQIENLSPDYHYPCDEKLMFEMVSRIMDNAVKFTKEGVITLSVKRLPSDLLIIVEDTGIGITPDVLEIAFKTYMQGDNTFTRPFDGLGLGLPFANMICQTLGGSLIIDSTPGKGTVVTMKLPL